MVKHERSEDADPTTSKRLKVDTPTSTPPRMTDSNSTPESPKSITTAAEPPEPENSIINSSPASVTTTADPPGPEKSVINSPPVKAESPPRPTSDVSTKSEIEQYFEYHFHKDRVFASPGDKKHPGSIPDYHISSTVLVSTLSNLSTAALKHFQDEYLDDVFVYIDRLEEFNEFADVALRFPKIGGRIKLDSRNVYEPEKRKMPQGLDAERGKKQLAEKVGRLEVWKKEVRRVVELIGEEMGLDEDAFKEKLASITPLPAKENEPLVKVGNAHINPVAADLKVLGYKHGGWSVNISCSSVHADEDKQKFQLWGDIGGVGGLWKYYEAQKEDAAVEVEVKKAQKEDATVEVDVEEAAKENGSS